MSIGGHTVAEPKADKRRGKSFSCTEGALCILSIRVAEQLRRIDDVRFLHCMSVHLLLLARESVDYQSSATARCPRAHVVCTSTSTRRRKCEGTGLVEGSHKSPTLVLNDKRTRPDASLP